MDVFRINKKSVPLQQDELLVDLFLPEHLLAIYGILPNRNFVYTSSVCDYQSGHVLPYRRVWGKFMKAECSISPQSHPSPGSKKPPLRSSATKCPVISPLPTQLRLFSCLCCPTPSVRLPKHTVRWRTLATSEAQTHPRVKHSQPRRHCPVRTGGQKGSPGQSTVGNCSTMLRMVLPTMLKIPITP
nr:unknown protein [synthetic construct]